MSCENENKKINCEICRKKLSYEENKEAPFDSDIIKNMLYYLDVNRPYYYCEKCTKLIEKKFMNFAKSVIG